MSVITPIYHGNRYLHDLRDMIEKSAIEASGTASVEWIIVNDSPDEKLDKVEDSERLSIKQIDDELHRGIQGARVTGLNKATGEFVLFLDQDDYIYPDWIISQIETIGNSDGCVCDALDFGHTMYGGPHRPSLDECVTADFNIRKYIGFNMGQTMIRRKSIPDLWKNRWLTSNCCDDHYLWLCMFANDCYFVSNPHVLFEHRRNENNQSLNFEEWAKSTHEMISIIVDEKIFSEDDTRSFIRSRERHIEEAIAEVYFSNLRTSFFRELAFFGTNEEIVNRFKKGELAIYGYELGRYLVEILLNHNISVNCIIDINALSINSDIVVYTIENTPKAVKSIISTLMKKENREAIKGYYDQNRPDIEIKDFWTLINEK